MNTTKKNEGIKEICCECYKPIQALSEINCCSCRKPTHARCSKYKNDNSYCKSCFSQDKKNEGRKEICICAAVKTTTGKIFRGHRHSDCIQAIVTRKLAMCQDQLSQGFITSKNRYVDRKEGYRLQIAAGIESKNNEFEEAGYCKSGELYSEDLY